MERFLLVISFILLVRGQVYNRSLLKQIYSEDSRNRSENVVDKGSSRYFTTNTQEQGYVNGGSLISFGSQLTAQEKSDILDSLLYAEQIADKKYDRTTYFQDWYKVYFDMLHKTTWKFEPISFEKYDSKETHFKLSSAVYTSLAATCQETQKELLNKLLTVWQSLQDFDKRVTCFLSNSGSATTETNVANFQIMPATRGQPGKAIIVFGGFYYHAQTTVERFLSFMWPSDHISLYYSVTLAEFSSENYNNLRISIQDTLGTKAINLVHEININ